MDCPGEYLKRERKLREVSLDDISREIKVPVKLLRALEADDYSSLPHATFVKGFITAYCKSLGVDENDALLRYELYLQEIAEFEKPAKKPKAIDVEERSYPVRKYLTLALVVVGVIIIAGVYYFSALSEETGEGEKLSRVESEEVVESVVKAEDNADKVVETKPVPKVVKSAPERKERLVEKTVKPIKIDDPKVESASVSPVIPATPEEVVVEEEEESAVVASLPALTPEEFLGKGLAPGEHLLRAHAKELTWMKVTLDYREPFEVMLQPDERAEWKGKVFFCS
jgi:cytoskeletal protein RodZ